MFREKANLNTSLKVISHLTQYLLFYTHNIFFQFLDIRIEHYLAHILLRIQDIYLFIFVLQV